MSAHVCVAEGTYHEEAEWIIARLRNYGYKVLNLTQIECILELHAQRSERENKRTDRATPSRRPER